MRRVVAPALLLVLSFASSHRSLAATADAADAGPRSAVVLSVGPRRVTVGELEDRLAEVPRFQLATFGADAPTIRRKFVDEVIVPDELLAVGAASRKLDGDPATALRLTRARSSATLRALRAQVGGAQSVSAEDVNAYYEKNRALYDAPERINVWRILCNTREEAAAVLELAKKDATVARFNDLARDRSIDKATYLRGGNLGFLGPDGASNEPGVKVDASLVAAARRVKDGEMVPEPVAEGAHWAVVWRRGTVGASKRTVDEVAAQIRDSVHRERIEKATQKLIADLRARDLRDVDESLLALVDVSPGDAGAINRRRP
jgi:peptidyl-prolyl cis-trans isomerase C